MVSGRRAWSNGEIFLVASLGKRFARVLRPEQYTVAPASPSASAAPRPTPRVAPATSATRPFRSGGWYKALVEVMIALRDAALVMGSRLRAVVPHRNDPERRLRSPRRVACQHSRRGGRDRSAPPSPLPRE